MIKSINSYTYKSFNTYSGPQGDEEFKQKNVFFGYNGKGKTALAKGILNEITKNPEVTENNYRFFDREFIKNNLLIENSTSIKGVVANFGKGNVDIEKEIAEKMKDFKDLTVLKENVLDSENKIKKEIEKIFNTKKGNTLIKRKNIENVYELVEAYKKDLVPAMKIVKNEDELKTIKDTSGYEKDLATLKVSNIIRINTLSIEDINTISNIMNTNYDKNEIPSATVLTWLEDGLKIHKHENSNICKFCGGSIEIKEIEDKINTYLNDKKQKDLIKLDKLYSIIKSVLELAPQLKENKKFIGNITSNDVYKHYDIIDNNINELETVSEQIKRKLENFDQTYEFNIEETNNIMENINNNIEKITSIKNAKEAELSNMIEKSNILVKGAIALEISNSTLIDEELTKLKSKEKELNESIILNEKITKDIKELKNKKSTTHDFASFINQLLEELGIDFYLDISENNYVIKHRRDYVPLSLDDISEGENNLLALLFFFYELFNDKDQKDYKKEIKTIIMDDPISSVDDVNKMYVLELIKKILELKEPQVFIFTHVWDDFCNISYGKKDVKDKDGNESPYRFYEVKKNNAGSYIKKTKTNESPYMHDFKEIFEFSQLGSADELDECEMYHYPNVMRKLLEEYMKFKVKNSSPTLDNITNVKIALCGDVNCSHQDDIQIPVLLDVCNILSHKTVRTPDQILKSAKYLMRKIKETDKNHFSTMTN